MSYHWDYRLEQEKWDKRFLGMAAFVATWSKDPSTQVGAVITDDNNRVISVGYNGFPKGVKDDARLADREQKLKIIVHAERNALLFASRDVTGCHLHTYPFMPCFVCAGMIIQAGIKRVVTIKNNNPRWKEDFKISKGLFDEVGIDLIEYPNLTFQSKER